MKPDLNPDPKSPALPPIKPGDPTQIIPHGPPPPKREPNEERPEEAPTQPQVPQQPATPRQVAAPPSSKPAWKRKASGHLVLSAPPQSDTVIIGRASLKSDPLMLIDFPRGHTPRREHGSAPAVTR